MSVVIKGLYTYYAVFEYNQPSVKCMGTRRSALRLGCILGVGVGLDGVVMGYACWCGGHDYDLL